MAEDNSIYTVYDYDTLHEGQELKIEHHLHLDSEKVDIGFLTQLDPATLQEQRNESGKAEKVIFDKLVAAVGEWEAQAAITRQHDMALEYQMTRPVQHTGNEWREDGYGNGSQEISNMVYRMDYRVYEDTHYDRAKGEQVVDAWQLYWNVRTQNPAGRYGSTKIAGQDRKRFTDKAAMDKYLQGRIKAYAGYFTEISPPIPPEFKSCFTVNGQLLPGYSMEGQELEQAHPPMEKEAGGKPSLRKQLEDGKEVQKNHPRPETAIHHNEPEH